MFVLNKADIYKNKGEVSRTLAVVILSSEKIISYYTWI